MQIFEPITFKRPEVIGVSDFRPQLFEDSQVTFSRAAAIFFAYVITQIGLHAIVVEQSVVNVEEKRYLLRPHDHFSAGVCGSIQGP